MLHHVATLVIAFLVLVRATLIFETASLGTLMRCTDSQCLWADGGGRAVTRYEMMRLMLQAHGYTLNESLNELKVLEVHARKIEDVVKIAAERRLSLPYQVGVTDHHLALGHSSFKSPQDFVEQELAAQRRRHLESLPHRDRWLQGLPEYFNWCSTDNPLKKSTCSPVKNQQTCGSCWSFAASDAIETAVAIESRSSARVLSPQQFLDCSRRRMTATFKYCWYSDAHVGSKRWLEPEMQWSSENKGCDGGMTHAAFADAAQLQLSLLSDLSLPYTETKTEATLLPGISTPSTSAPRFESERNKSCVRRSDDAVATITGWKQAVGNDCSVSSDPTQLLKIALQKQPLSVAITARGTFKEYKGGIYECPDNGEISDSSWLNHAIVLVGYGSEGGVDYWILKNSFGSSWGEKGFMRLRADNKLNCGLNIFPVVPTGAVPGNAKLAIEGGGPVRMLGLSPTAWMTIAVLTTLITGGLTAFGIVVSRRRRHNMLREAVLQ